MLIVMCYWFGADAGLHLGFFTGVILALMVLGTRRLPVLAAVAGPALGIAIRFPRTEPDRCNPRVAAFCLSVERDRNHLPHHSGAGPCRSSGRDRGNGIGI